MSLALYLSRVRSSEVLGIRRGRPLENLTINGLVGALHFYKANSELIADSCACVHPLQCFVVFRVNFAKSLARDFEVEVPRRRRPLTRGSDPYAEEVQSFVTAKWP